MAYLGNTPQTQSFTPAIDYFNGTGSTTAFTLSRPVASVAQVQAVIENVPQNPGSAYTVSGQTITFTSAPPAGTNNIYVYYTSPITQVATLSQDPVITGSMTFGTIGARIKGDFSNATPNNRVALQTSTTNGNTIVNLLPNGTGAASQVLAISSSDPTNSSFGQFRIGTDFNELRISSGILGTGTYLPMTFHTGGSERMRIDTSGNVGIGTSGPGAKLDVLGGATLIGATNVSARFTDNVNSTLVISHPASNGNTAMLVGASQIGFGTSNGTTTTERMRIDSSGNFMVGTTTPTGASSSAATATVASTSNDALKVYTTNVGAAIYTQINRASAAAGGFYLYFTNGSSAASTGNISTNGTTTTYNTSSDYRLKENIQPMVGALNVVAQLNPVTYNWKSNGSDGQGFLAHELQAVVPDCVTGEKDAIDADGNPIYQGVDTSFLVATLTAAIQEQQAIIEDLKARIETLEAK